MTTPHVAYEIPVLRVGTWPASVDFSTETVPGVPDFQFVAMDLYDPASFSGVDNYAGACIGLPSAGYPIIGILQNNPTKNDSADIWVEGLSKAVLSGTVSVGQILKVDTNGKFLVATSATFGVAKALSNGSSGDIIAVWLQNFGKQ
jgi:hypothetical protein